MHLKMVVRMFIPATVQESLEKLHFGIIQDNGNANNKRKNLTDGFVCDVQFIAQREMPVKFFEYIMMFKHFFPSIDFPLPGNRYQASHPYVPDESFKAFVCRIVTYKAFQVI